jgi:hypothetical protein
MNSMTHQLVLQSEVEVVLRSEVVHQVLLVSIRVLYVIEHLQAIAYSNMKKRVRKLVNSDVCLIRLNNEYKEQKQQHFIEKEK